MEREAKRKLAEEEDNKKKLFEELETKRI